MLGIEQHGRMNQLIMIQLVIITDIIINGEIITDFLLKQKMQVLEKYLRTLYHQII
jgi:hypothetical protein